MKHLFSIVLSIGLFLFGAGMSVKRGLFLMSAERANGQVESLTASNDRCGSKNSKHDCTKFSAKVNYSSAAGARGVISVAAGDARGYNQPVTRAALQPGSSVPVIFSSSDVTYAFRDTFFDIWVIPLGSLFGSGIFFVGALRRH